MAFSVGFREAVAYSLSCLNERNKTSRIRHREISRVYGMVSKRKLQLPQVFWDKLARACALGPWQCLPGPVSPPPPPPPVTLIKQGLGTRLDSRQSFGQLNGGGGDYIIGANETGTSARTLFNCISVTDGIKINEQNNLIAKGPLYLQIEFEAI